MISIRTAFVALAALAALQLPSHGLSMGVGPKAGVNLGGADVDDVENQERRIGLAGGVMAEFGVTSPYSLVLEALYLQRGARFDILGIEAEGDLDYFEIPALLKAKFGKTSGHAYVFAGPSFGFRIGSEGRYVGFEDGFEDQVASFALSGDIGAGGAFQVSKYVYLSADARYTHGFTDALEDPIGEIDSWHARDIRLMAGLLFHLTE